jgi:hypothetical protein
MHNTQLLSPGQLPGLRLTDVMPWRRCSHQGGVGIFFLRWTLLRRSGLHLRLSRTTNGFGSFCIVPGTSAGLVQDVVLKLL